MQALLGDIAAGVLVNVITATGRWIAASAGSGRAGRDGDIAAWFDTYELTENEFPQLTGMRARVFTRSLAGTSLSVIGPDDADVAAWLRGSNVHAVLHELLAVRLTDAPESDVERLRGALRDAGWSEIGNPIASEAGLVGDPKPERALRAVIDRIADQVFDWADGEICELVARFGARDPERWRAARQDAFGARIVAVLNSIDRHLSALDDRPDPRADTTWEELYRRQATQAYGTIEPPDFARRRKVPIGDLYVPPDIIAPGAARDAGGNPATIGFDDLAGRIDRTVLLGDPGGGKSTASRVLAYGWAGGPSGLISAACPNCSGRIVDGFCEVCGVSAPAAGGGETPPYPAGRSRVPFLVVLREFAAGDGPRGSVVEHIEERLNTFHQCPAPRGAVERLLLSGGAAVIFDGLDELIDTSRRIEVTRIVEQFCARFPLAPVLVTSRLVGYDEARLDDGQFEVYRIAGFTRDETAAYVRNWFAQEDGVDVEEAERLADAFMRESEQVADLRSNPLMLALMCILYRGEGTLPRNRPGVYAECARMLFDKWDTRRGIHVDLQARNLIEPALRHIAYWLFTRTGSPEVTEAELVARVADLLHERGFEQRHDAEAAAGEFVRFCRGRAWILGDAGTTARGEPLYTFTHRTFLEYFTAAYLASVYDTPELLANALAPQVAMGQWDVVGQLAVQIKDAATDRGAERVLTAMLNDKTQMSDAGPRIVAFAARCLDVADVPPALVRDITDRAFDQLREDDREQALWHLPLWRERTGDVIAEVIAERVADLMDSGDRRLAARFSAYATFCAAESRNYTYWHRLEGRLTDTHRDALIEVARRDDAVWMRLIDRGVITLAEGLELRDGRLDMLLKTIEVRPGRWYWTPYVAQAFWQYGAQPYWRNAENALSPDPDAAVDRIRAFAQAMPDLPAPPWWIPRIEGIWLGLGDEDFPELRDMTPAEACAATVLAMLAAEQFYADFMDSPGDQEIPACPASMVDHFDRFDALRTRAAEAPGPWPDRIDRWLRGELDFVQWQDGDEPE